jgi:hypothetical protein
MYNIRRYKEIYQEIHGGVFPDSDDDSDGDSDDDNDDDSDDDSSDDNIINYIARLFDIIRFGFDNNEIQKHQFIVFDDIIKIVDDIPHLHTQLKIEIGNLLDIVFFTFSSPHQFKWFVTTFGFSPILGHNLVIFTLIDQSHVYDQIDHMLFLIKDYEFDISPFIFEITEALVNCKIALKEDDKIRDFAINYIIPNLNLNNLKLDMTINKSGKIKKHTKQVKKNAIMKKTIALVLKMKDFKMINALFESTVDKKNLKVIFLTICCYDLIANVKLIYNRNKGFFHKSYLIKVFEAALNAQASSVAHFLDINCNFTNNQYKNDHRIAAMLNNACSNNNLETIQWILNICISSNIDQFKFDAFSILCKNGHLDTIKILYNKYALTKNTEGLVYGPKKPCGVRKKCSPTWIGIVHPAIT